MDRVIYTGPEWSLVFRQIGSGKDLGHIWMARELNVFHNAFHDMAVLSIVRRTGEVAMIRAPSSWTRIPAGFVYRRSNGRVVPVKTNFADAQRRSAMFLLGGAVIKLFDDFD